VSDGEPIQGEFAFPKRPDINEIRQRHPKAYERWSSAADALLLEGYVRDGRSIRELALEFDRQPSAIESRLKKLAFDLLGELRPDHAAARSPVVGADLVLRGLRPPAIAKGVKEDPHDSM
jgi:hypothetical protein